MGVTEHCSPCGHDFRTIDYRHVAGHTQKYAAYCPCGWSMSVTSDLAWPKEALADAFLRHLSHAEKETADGA